MPPSHTHERHVVSTAAAAQRVASEDRLLVERGAAGLLIVVADGAGGMRGGARAADMLVQHVRANLLEVTCDGATAGALSGTLYRADRAIAADPAAGETTAIALVVTEDRILGASAGDSEAWLLDGEECDVLSASQDRRRIGSGRAAPSSFVRAFTRGVLIVATDGLFANATLDAIRETMRRAPTDAIAQRLIERVRLPRGGLADDVAVVVVAAPLPFRT